MAEYDHQQAGRAYGANNRNSGAAWLSGDVIGFVVSFSDGAAPLCITGDTVWYDGVAEVARRFRPAAILLFAGSARTRSPFNLTMDANDAIETAHAFPNAMIVPIHRDSWAHFTQNAKDLEDSFKALGIASRLLILEPGVPTPITAS